MRTILHILTRPEDELTRELFRRQQSLPQTRIEIVALNTGHTDYDALVEKIFAADSVAVW